MFWSLEDGEEGNCRTTATTETTSCGFCGACGSEREQFRDLSKTSDIFAAIWGSLGKISCIYAYVISVMPSSWHWMFSVCNCHLHFRNKGKKGQRKSEFTVKTTEEESTFFPTQEIRKWFQETTGKFMCLKLQFFSVLPNQVPREK